jgi:hypothetical protein
MSSGTPENAYELRNPGLTTHHFLAELSDQSIKVEVHWGPKGVGFHVRSVVDATDEVSPDQLTMGFELLESDPP